MIGRVQDGLFAAFLFACLVLGGASRGGFEANLALQLGGIALLGWGLYRLDWRTLPAHARLLLGLGALGLVVIAAQFIVLPFETWRGLPGRGDIAAELALLGVEPDPATLSLSLHDSLRSATWMLPAVGLALALLAGRTVPAVALAATLVGTSLLALVVGIAQVLGGAETGWYFYGFTNRSYMVGFFANANHMATLLLVTLPFIAALVREGRMRFPKRRFELTGFGIALFALVAIGVGIVGSMTGYALIAPVALASALIVFPVRQRLGWIMAVPLLAAVAVLLAVIGGEDNAFVAEADASMASRGVMNANTFEAARDFFPVGSGLGTFEDVYRRYEDQSAVTTTFINHAHNDYAELLLELGAAGALLIALFVAWWLACLRQLLKREASAFAWAGWIAVGVILTHSGWDYPLRTAALGTVFAMACVFASRLSLGVEARGVSGEGAASGGREFHRTRSRERRTVRRPG